MDIQENDSSYSRGNNIENESKLSKNNANRFGF